MIEKLMKAALAGNPELVHKYDHEVIATSLEVYAESFDAAGALLRRHLGRPMLLDGGPEDLQLGEILGRPVEQARGQERRAVSPRRVWAHPELACSVSRALSHSMQANEVL